MPMNPNEASTWKGIEGFIKLEKCRLTQASLQGIIAPDSGHSEELEKFVKNND